MTVQAIAAGSDELHQPGGSVAESYYSRFLPFGFFMVRVSPALSSLLFLASVVLADGASSSKCASFTLSGNTNATVTNTTYYPKGTRVKLSTSMSSLDAEDLQDFCRVELTVITNATANSAAHTEVWLPDSWNNRFLTFGNGGFAGGSKQDPLLCSRCQTDLVRS